MELFERSRQSLYHSTRVELSITIVQDNTIHDNTTQCIEFPAKDYFNTKFKHIDGVSLTRSWRFAQSWGQVIFEFDQDQLKTKFKFIPYNYFYNQKSTYRHTQRREAEEFLVGPLTNIERYLKYIWVFPQYTDVNNFPSSYSQDTINQFGSLILNHRKCKVMSY